MVDFAYNNFDGSGSVGAVDSSFSETLGGVLVTDGLIYDAYYSVAYTQGSLTVVMDGADQFATGLPTFTSGINAAIDAI